MKLTVFTPTYNRAHTLRRVYESLCTQTATGDFEWLVVDDGSTDFTRPLVESFIREGRIPIRYIYKENGGLFTAYNTAVENISSILNVCIDSDDFLPEDAVEIIFMTWEQIKDNDNLAGIIGLDFSLDGKPVGGMFRSECDGYFHDQRYRLGHIGDTKIVCRTDLMKSIFPMPSFGEKNFNPVWYYLKIGEHRKFRIINRNLCFVDYQTDGMTANIYRQYADSPKSFAELRREYMKSRHLPLRRKFIDAAHYVSSSLLAHEHDWLRKSPKKVLTLLAVPAGLLIHAIILKQLSRSK